MRLMQLLAGAGRGGAEEFFVHTVLAFQRAGFEQEVAIRRDAERAGRLRGAGVPTRELRFGSPAWDHYTPLALRAAVRRFRPDVAMSWMSRASRHIPRGDHVNVARLGGYYPIKHYRKIDHFVVIAPAIGAHLERQGVRPERIHLIPSFPGTASLPPLDRAELGTPAEAPLVVTAGRLHRNKGFDTFLEALAAVPGAYAWIAGSGPDEAALRELAARLGIEDRVRFLGWRRDVAALYASADVFVCPSRHEPFGRVVLEAWAHGAPLVTTDADGPAWLVTPERDAIVTPVDDVGAMAAAIARVLDDPALRDRLRRAGRETQQAHYSEARMVERFRELFEALTR